MSLKDALQVDGAGAPTDRHLVLESRSWDEIGAMNDEVYMPFRVRPTGTGKPWSTSYAATVGPFTVNRFRYGAGVDLDRFEPEAGRGIVLTTVAGRVTHQEDTVTGAGETFLVDASRSPYRLRTGVDNEQLNISFCHRDLADLHHRWFGVQADPRMWANSFKLGGPGSSWMSLLDYTMRGIAEFPDLVAEGPLGRRLGEMVGVHLLTEWRNRTGDLPRDPVRAGAAPRYVLAAEEFMREHARSAPTLADVASEVGVSVRALTLGFRRHREQSPIAFLRDLRMEGARADLDASGPDDTVSSVIAAWGYVNHGVFARSYEQRFGELPSVTLSRPVPSS